MKTKMFYLFLGSWFDIEIHGIDNETIQVSPTTKYTTICA